MRRLEWSCLRTQISYIHIVISSMSIALKQSTPVVFLSSSVAIWKRLECIDPKTLFEVLLFFIILLFLSSFCYILWHFWIKSVTIKFSYVYYFWLILRMFFFIIFRVRLVYGWMRICRMNRLSNDQHFFFDVMIEFMRYLNYFHVFCEFFHFTWQLVVVTSHKKFQQHQRSLRWSNCFW